MAIFLFLERLFVTVRKSVLLVVQQRNFEIICACIKRAAAERVHVPIHADFIFLSKFNLSPLLSGKTYSMEDKNVTSLVFHTNCIRVYCVGFEFEFKIWRC